MSLCSVLRLQLNPTFNLATITVNLSKRITFPPNSMEVEQIEVQKLFETGMGGNGPSAPTPPPSETRALAAGSMSGTRQSIGRFD